MKDRNIELKANYQRLRQAGFSSADATRLRGSGPEKINKMLATGLTPPKDPGKVYARTGQAPTAKQKKDYQKQVKTWLKIDPKNLPPEKHYIKGKITNYQEAGKAGTYQYLSAYTYVIRYKVKEKDGTETWKVISITSNEPMTKKELFKEMNESVFPAVDSKYTSRIIRKSYKVIGAYINKDMVA